MYSNCVIESKFSIAVTVVFEKTDSPKVIIMIPKTDLKCSQHKNQTKKDPLMVQKSKKWLRVKKKYTILHNKKRKTTCIFIPNHYKMFKNNNK